MTFHIPTIIKLPHALSHEELSFYVQQLVDAKRLGKVPSHLCKALARLPVAMPLYRDDAYRYYGVDDWYKVACQLPYGNGEFSIPSKRAFYNQIAVLKATDLLLAQETSVSKETHNELLKSTGQKSITQYLRVSPPNLKWLVPKVIKKTSQPMLEPEHPSCMLIADDELSHGGSLHITARLLNHVVNISSTPCFENIEGEVTVKDAKTQREGTVWVRASSLRDVPVMDASHVVLVNVIYKLIIYRMATLFANGDLSSNYQNLFGFPKSVLSKYLGKTDGGKTREYFDAVMKIITSTSFEVHDKGGASWFFEKLGLIDDTGKPFVKATLNLLSSAGERSTDDYQPRTASPTHIFVRMAPHLDDAIRSALTAHEQKIKPLVAHDFHSLLQYPRQRTLFSQHNGILQLLTDYFAYRLVSPGAFYASDLASLLHKINYSIRDSKCLTSVLTDTFKTLMHSNTILTTRGVVTNSRNQIRIDSLTAFINGRYLVRITATNNHTQLGRRTYEFSVLHVNKTEMQAVRERQQFLLNHLSSLKQRNPGLDALSHITAEDPMDAQSFSHTVDSWLAPRVNKNLYLKRQKVS